MLPLPRLDLQDVHLRAILSNASFCLYQYHIPTPVYMLGLDFLLPPTIELSVADFDFFNRLPLSNALASFNSRPSGSSFFTW